MIEEKKFYVIKCDNCGKTKNCKDSEFFWDIECAVNKETPSDYIKGFLRIDVLKKEYMVCSERCGIELIKKLYPKGQKEKIKALSDRFKIIKKGGKIK